jgi:hypothetical protein
MNVGVPEVESLTGYVARIAEAHCVTVSDLVGAELSDPASPTPLLTPYPGKQRSNCRLAHSCPSFQSSVR